MRRLVKPDITGPNPVRTAKIWKDSEPAGARCRALALVKHTRRCDGKGTAGSGLSDTRVSLFEEELSNKSVRLDSEYPVFLSNTLKGTPGGLGR
jgi:hypothetical protein